MSYELMKNVEKLLLLLFFSFMLILLTISCKKESDNTQINITEPTNNQEFNCGQTVSISAIVTDVEGMNIEVKFYIHEIYIRSHYGPPYTYDWLTSTNNAGDQTIRVELWNMDEGEILSYDEVKVFMAWR